ncbi:hypothetical protein GCM10023231_11290 [Olivibacter ginsenosidimutans]|uniref:Antitoxin n=1 Tax=Olivibacter ginsenosidimutans TaxID=1176537 RepID=A0ABP9AVI1_9SPHI
MERIVIEVDDKLAKAWRNASEQQKKTISNRVNVSLAKALGEDNTAEYLMFLSDLRKDMSAKGLTEAELNDILNEE